MTRQVRHLVTGAEGQDGRLLIAHLRSLGHDVIGTGRADLDITDPGAVREAVARWQPTLMHNLAGQSSVRASWDDPELSERINHQAVLGLLEVAADAGIGLVQASSSEIFGSATGTADASTPRNPTSPYGSAKAAAHAAVQAAREAGLPATNLILFGHTSVEQSPRFALPGICRQAAEIAQGRRRHLEVQDPSVRRDWGSARDYVRAFACAADAPPGDYVVGSGRLTALSDVVAWALAAAGVADAEVRVTGTDRPHDHDGLVADLTQTTRVLRWQPEVPLRDEVEAMVRHDLAAAP